MEAKDISTRKVCESVENKPAQPFKGFTDMEIQKTVVNYKLTKLRDWVTSLEARQMEGLKKAIKCKEPGVVEIPKCQQPPPRVTLEELAASKKLCKDGNTFSEEKWKKLRAALDAGWKREVVLRSKGTSGRRPGNVYYHAPNGKKFGYSTQVEAYLAEQRNSSLTLDHFSFNARIRVGGNPEQELLREANNKRKLWVSKLVYPSTRVVAGNRVLATMEKDSLTTKEGSSIPPLKRYGDTFGLKARMMGASNTSRTNQASLCQTLGNGNESMKLVPLGQQNSTFAYQDLIRCSLQCPDAYGEVPGVQCAHCLCLFHTKCLKEIAPYFQSSQHFICSNCSGQNVTANTVDANKFAVSKGNKEKSGVPDFARVKFQEGAIREVVPKSDTDSPALSPREIFPPFSKTHPNTGKGQGDSLNMPLVKAPPSTNLERIQPSLPTPTTRILMHQPGRGNAIPEHLTPTTSKDKSLIPFVKKYQQPQSVVQIGDRSFVVITKRGCF